MFWTVDTTVGYTYRRAVVPVLKKNPRLKEKAAFQLEKREKEQLMGQLLFKEIKSWCKSQICQVGETQNIKGEKR